MRKLLAAGFVCGLSIICAAQTPPTAAAPGPQARPAANAPRSLPNIIPGTLKDTAKFRYICAQLDLSSEQSASVDGLIATYEANHKQVMGDMQANLDRIRDLSGQLQEATKANDTARMNAIQAELGQFGSTAAIEAEFFSNLEQLLKPEQRTTLEEVRDLLTRNPTGAFRPIDVLNTARALNPDEAQRTKLNEVEMSFRKQINSGPPVDPAKRDSMLTALISDVRATLTEAQATAFDARIARMKKAAPAPPTPRAATPPAAPVGPGPAPAGARP